jgi:hypothetical protein
MLNYKARQGSSHVDVYNIGVHVASASHLMLQVIDDIYRASAVSRVIEATGRVTFQQVKRRQCVVRTSRQLCLHTETAFYYMEGYISFHTFHKTSPVLKTTLAPSEMVFDCARKRKPNRVESCQKQIAYTCKTTDINHVTNH